MSDSEKLKGERLLRTFRVDGSCLYMVGTFDVGVTVYSQQRRALNLAWSLVESELIKNEKEKDSARENKKIAIIGAGFAGLTLAAGLLQKGADLDITIFEQRDALLPLQQGSDSRWLHPRIYDWPKVGSEASVAMLPVLNWTAARASDVVVQVLSHWRRIVENNNPESSRLFCNAKHLQVHETGSPRKKLRIEWVGEERNFSDGTAFNGKINSAVGKSKDFDFVVLAVGFGVERDGALSYWRNETLGQPSLDESRRSFLISGQGDGAMIDLLRIRISQYRQDRILDEMFAGRNKLLTSIRRLCSEYAYPPYQSGLFKELEKLECDDLIKNDFSQACDVLRKRLRRDTEAILRLQVRKLSQLFDPGTSKISFQNKLLVFFLYKCGGFIPSALNEDKLIKQHQIIESRVVRRHGTYRDEQLKEMLSEPLYMFIDKRRNGAPSDSLFQADDPKWPGGYFDFYGPSKESGKIGDEIRAFWRKEYLPGPTEMLVTTFCSAIAGLLLLTHPSDKRLRVTIHRAIKVNAEELLQQACDYEGTADARGEKSAAGRTFPAENGTIGLAYRCRKIVRSFKGVDAAKLNAAMEPLRLHEASRKMSKNVSFVLAIPLLEPMTISPYTLPSPVLGTIYVDSTAPNFYIDDKLLVKIVAMANSFLRSLTRSARLPIERTRNIHLEDLADNAGKAEKMPSNLGKLMELVKRINSPSVDVPLQLNFDYSDFTLAPKSLEK